MLPTISQVCSLPSLLATDLEDYAAARVPAVELWLTKLETHLESHTIDDVQRLVATTGVKLPAASFQGGLLSSQGERRREAWGLFARRLKLCEALGIATLVVACDVPRPLDPTTLERVQVSLAQAAQEAGRHGVRVALEFQASSAIGSNIHTAAALVADVGSPHLGLCLDAFHYFTGPSKPEDLGYLHAGNLFHVQLCDLADRPRELYTDSDRILPGDGEIPLGPLLARLKEIGYQGAVSVEVLNPLLWQVPARNFGEIAITALRKLLGIAEM